MNQQQLTLTRLLGKKETQHIEGCQAYTDKCGKKNSDGVYICMYCSRWRGNDRYEEVSATPTLSDFHRWMNKHFKEDWMQDEKEIGYVLKLKEYFDYDLNTQMIALKPTIAIYYDSSKDLLEQSTETLTQIIELITNNS